MILSHKKVEKIKQPHAKSRNRLHQPALNSILGWLKLIFKSDFTVRLVETDLGRWSLVVAVISGEGYPFSDVYIPYHKYQVKPHLSPWFSATCVAAIVHRNNFFHLYEQNKFSESKVKFRQACHCCKYVLQIAKLAYANITKKNITSQKLGSRDLWQIANSLLNKSKSTIPPLSNNPEALTNKETHLIKQNCFLKPFLRTLILMTQTSFYLFSLQELIWNCTIFL